LSRKVVFRQSRKRVSLVRVPPHDVRRRRQTRAGSTVSSGLGQNLASQAKHLSTILLNQEAMPPATSPIPHKTQSEETPPAIPVNADGREAIRSAAQRLARLPRGAKRKLSGYAGTVRLWRGRPILVAGDTRAYALGARRQQVVFCLDPELTLERGRWGVIPASAITILKDQSAIILGRLKKGRSEKWSSTKQQAARKNGKCACKQGRARGRPRERWAA